MWRLTSIPRVVAAAITALAAFHDDARAQRRVRPSLMLGASSSTMKMADVDLDARVAVTIGGSVVVPITPSLGLETGLTYIQKGGTAKDPAEAIELAINLDYLEVPVLLRYQFNGERVQPFAIVGGAFAFRTACRLEAKVEGIRVSTGCQGEEEVTVPAPGEGPAAVTNDEIVKKTDASLVVGGGIDVGRLTFGWRYDHGLTNIDNGGEDVVKNRSLSIFTGVRLGRE